MRLQKVSQLIIFYLMTGSQMSEGSSMKQTTKQLSNEHLQLQQTQEESSLERGFPIDDFDSIEDIEDINGEYNDNNVHHQYLVSSSNTNIGILFPKLFWPTVRKNYSSDLEKLWLKNRPMPEISLGLIMLRRIEGTTNGMSDF